MNYNRQAIEEANRAFGQEKMMEISLLKTSGPVETMTVNAAGLIEAFRLGAIHCYRQPCKQATQVLLSQVRQLPPWPGVNAREVLLFVQRFVRMLLPEWKDEIWQSWAFNMRRWKVKKIPFVILHRDEINVFCGENLLLEYQEASWRLSHKVKRIDLQPYWEPLWIGSEISPTLFASLRVFNSAIVSFVSC